MSQNLPPPFPSPPMYPSGRPMTPHRGTAVLVLGILGLVLCLICGIIAWVMGSTDLREMDAGRMDPTGRGMTQAGRICGIISVVLHILGIGVWLLMVVVFGVAAAAGAGHP
jgi:hypothetical protein